MSLEALFETSPCAVCGEEQYTVLRSANYPPNLTQEALAHVYSASSQHVLLDQIVKCNNCELIYLNPRARRDVILSSYANAVDPTFVEHNPLRVATFQRNLAALCKELEILPCRERHVLDVGCAGGAFPAAAHQLGFSVVGVEPSAWLSEEARKNYGLDIRTGTLESQHFNEASFDIVTLWDVIEHLIEPKVVLERIRTLLKNEGLIVINYPDHGSLARRALGDRWPFYLSVHLIYFTISTIQRFLEQLGFRVILVKPYWQTLGLGYVLQRATPYLGALKVVPKVFSRAVEWLGCGDLPVRYNMGQTMVVARKHS
jgi:2-polyprenyl-3-methyl-5-hydroxy-6-metoxy-1,4-benzoquinol methylase